MPKTKRCAGCGVEFEPKPANRQYHSAACKQKAWRMRHAKPVSLEALMRSQRRANRKHDSHYQRPQELGGARVESLETVPEVLDCTTGAHTLPAGAELEHS